MTTSLDPLPPTPQPFRLPRELLQALHRRSAWRGAWAVAFDWLLVAGAFALFLAWPGVASAGVALVVIGGRQLGMGILMHDCAHRALFRSATTNDVVGEWLCAAPMGADLAVYRAYHMTHHRHTGTAADPDLANYAGYPVSRASLARKVARDLTGLTGLRALATLAALYATADPRAVGTGYAYRRDGDAGEAAATGGWGTRVRRGLWHARRILLVQAAMLAVFIAIGHPLAWLLWPAAWMTTYMVFSRIRNAAEHGALPGTMTADPWANTRSVTARWWERLTVAPHHVNFHLEHHLAPTVPGYRLPRLRAWLQAQGVVGELPVVDGYGAVVRALVSR